MKLIDAEPLESLLCARAAQCSNDYGSIAGAISGCLKLVQAQPVISSPSNPPLTLEELREMDGEPVWVEMLMGRFQSHWAVIRGEFAHDGRFYDDKNKCPLSLGKEGGYGMTWLAYRRKKGEGLQ